jgi:hypothetical protein
MQMGLRKHKMREHDIERDIIQDTFRQHMRNEVIRNLRLTLNIIEVSSVITPILLALILWRVW